MELKLISYWCTNTSDILLIVPYGIETYNSFGCHIEYNLLIVPYGIETRRKRLMKRDEARAFNRTLWNWNRQNKTINEFFFTFNRTLWNWNVMKRLLFGDRLTFNRTLWNWNNVGAAIFLLTNTFNRTLWNWNCVECTVEQTEKTLLIVPYGIETT